MLFKIPLLSFLIFGILYPLCFWLSVKDPIKHHFHRFHLACPLIFSSLTVMTLYTLPVIPHDIKVFACLWVLAFGVVTAVFWNKETVPPLAVTLLALWGIKLFANVYAHLGTPHLLEVAIWVLAGFVVASMLYAMNLGHFYLNVHGLPLVHLRNAMIAYVVFLSLRLTWDIYYMLTAKVVYQGQEMPLMAFMGTMDGFFLWVALFFGTVFPLVGSYFAFGTLKLKNTQATTGILYVLLSAVLLGDLAYKYFLLKFGIPL